VHSKAQERLKSTGKGPQHQLNLSSLSDAAAALAVGAVPGARAGHRNWLPVPPSRAAAAVQMALVNASTLGKNDIELLFFPAVKAVFWLFYSRASAP